MAKKYIIDSEITKEKYRRVLQIEILKYFYIKLSMDSTTAMAVRDYKFRLPYK